MMSYCCTVITIANIKTLKLKLAKTRSSGSFIDCCGPNHSVKIIWKYLRNPNIQSSPCISSQFCLHKTYAHVKMGKKFQKSFIGNNLKVLTAKMFFSKLLVKQITLLHGEIALRICEKETWTNGMSMATPNSKRSCSV